MSNTYTPRTHWIGGPPLPYTPPPPKLPAGRLRPAGSKIIDKVLADITQHPTTTIREIAERIGLKGAQVRDSCRRLQAYGHIAKSDLEYVNRWVMRHGGGN